MSVTYSGIIRGNKSRPQSHAIKTAENKETAN